MYWNSSKTKFFFFLGSFLHSVVRTKRLQRVCFWSGFVGVAFIPRSHRRFQFRNSGTPLTINCRRARQAMSTTRELEGEGKSKKTKRWKIRNFLLVANSSRFAFKSFSESYENRVSMGRCDQVLASSFVALFHADRSAANSSPKKGRVTISTSFRRLYRYELLPLSHLVACSSPPRRSRFQTLCLFASTNRLNSRTPENRFSKTTVSCSDRYTRPSGL